METRIERLRQQGWTIHHRSARFAFATTGTRTLFITPDAIYEILCVQQNSRYPYDQLRSEIERGFICSLVELLTEMRLKPGQGLSYAQINEEREIL